MTDKIKILEEQLERINQTLDRVEKKKEQEIFNVLNNFRSINFAKTSPENPYEKIHIEDFDKLMDHIMLILNGKKQLNPEEVKNGK